MPPVLEQGFFQSAYAQYCAVVETLSAEASAVWEHGEVERYINTSGREILRRLFQGHLDRRYSEEGYHRDVVGSDGEVRPHRRKRTQRQLETLFGEVVVTRVGYSRQQAGVSALYPGDGQLNLPPDKYSDELRRRVAEEASKVSFAETSRTIGETIGDSREPPERPAIRDKRVWASVQQDAKTVIASAVDEALARDPERQREWVVLVDGEPHQLTRLQAMAQQHAVDVTIVLDFIHVLEDVWKAAFCFCPVGSPAADAWVQEHALRLLDGQAQRTFVAARPSRSFPPKPVRTPTNALIICSSTTPICAMTTTSPRAIPLPPASLKALVAI